MAEQLIITLKTVTGSPMPLTIAYTVNERGFPFFSEWRKVGDGEVAIRHPKEEPFGLAILHEIPGFGRVITTADNEGRFYRLGDGPIDFRLEAARTKVARLSAQLQRAEDTGRPAPKIRRDQVAATAARLKTAAGLPAGERQARALDDVLSEAFWLGEELELEYARSAIDKMSVDQRSEMLFGASFFNPDADERYMYHFRELLNFATIPFYRRAVEAVEGQPEWTQRDRLLDILDTWGMKRKGHPLSWWIQHGLADWMKRLSYTTLKEVIYQQVFDTVARYKNRVRIWDVINEAHDPIVKGNDLNLNEDQVYEITELACRATRDADPSAIRIVNVNRPWCVYRSEWEMMDPMHAIEYVEGLAERGIDYEVLGVQMYHGGPEHYVRDMTEQSALIDSYAALGKPIHITEVQSPSSMNADPTKWLGGPVAPSGWWHRPWDPEIQADWAEQFYTIATSKPEVGAITWWSLSDQATFWPHGGLLDADNQPKPAYYRLLKFIRELRAT